jgi:DNA-binding MarR family transcriptional regulator
MLAHNIPLRGERCNLEWPDNDSQDGYIERKRILTGQECQLLLGSLRSEAGGAIIHWELHSGNRTPGLAEFTYVPQFGSSAAPRTEFEVVISSDPPLPAGPWRGKYVFDHNGLRESGGSEVTVDQQLDRPVVDTFEQRIAVERIRKEHRDYVRRRFLSVHESGRALLDAVYQSTDESLSCPEARRRFSEWRRELVATIVELKGEQQVAGHDVDAEPGQFSQKIYPGQQPDRRRRTHTNAEKETIVQNIEERLHRLQPYLGDF